MYLITIMLGAHNWSLTYREPSHADKAFNILTSGALPMELEDDFGCRIVLHDAPTAIQRADVSKTFEGQASLGLYQARAQGKLNAMAQRDPELMFLSGGVGLNGSRIIQPGGG